MQEMDRFLRDKYRGISVDKFADICGVSEVTLRKVFGTKERPLTYETQVRVNKGYAQWKAGRVRVMRRPNGTVYADYRKEAKPVFMPQMGLKMTPAGIKLDLGVRNRHDYSKPTLDQQLRGKT